MIVTVYGDRIAAGSNTRLPYTWAIEDQWNHARGIQAHPDNVVASFGFKLARVMHLGFHCGAVKDSTAESIVLDHIAVMDKNPEKNIVVISWGDEHYEDIGRISAFGETLNGFNTPHCFINTSTRHQTLEGRWLWDTEKQDIRSWARSIEEWDGDHLTSRGHTLLANMLMVRLTTQLDNCIVVK